MTKIVQKPQGRDWKDYILNWKIVYSPIDFQHIKNKITGKPLTRIGKAENLVGFLLKIAPREVPGKIKGNAKPSFRK